MSLWKGKRAQDPGLESAADRGPAEEIDRARSTSLAEAHLQLGNLYSDQTKYAEAIPEYVRARELSPDLADVHYRLGQAYVHTRQKELAQQSCRCISSSAAEHLAEVDKQRADIRQFVYSAKDGPTAK